MDLVHIIPFLVQVPEEQHFKGLLIVRTGEDWQISGELNLLNW